MRAMFPALALLALAPLAACKQADETQLAAVVPSGTLGEAIAAAPGLSDTAAALKDTGIVGALNGKGSYTLFAPTNEAFAAYGADAGKAGDEEQRAALAAILRDHIVPGFLTAADITKAIDADKDGKVEMITMGGHRLIFSKSGSGIAVTSENGAQAKITGDPVTATNGVVLPVDAVLKSAD